MVLPSELLQMSEMAGLALGWIVKNEIRHFFLPEHSDDNSYQLDSSRVRYKFSFLWFRRGGQNRCKGVTCCLVKVEQLLHPSRTTPSQA
jgi:hypothetical protein